MKIKKTQTLYKRRILVGITGSIAAVKSPELISELISSGAEVRCMVTQSAARLVSPVAIASLSRNPCLQDEDQWSANQPRPLHISLAEWAEIIIIAPLTASTLSRWVNGLGEGLVASVLLASEKPVIAAAAMNSAMWENDAVQKNWELLLNNPRFLGLNPTSGLLACNRIGDGRMAEPKAIKLAIESCIIQADEQGHLPRDFKGEKILVSAGPTFESLDIARGITNRSSGKMGVLIAQAARFRGAEVDLIHGPLSVPEEWLEGLNTYRINDSEELQNKLSQLQRKAKALIMAAAVADLRRTKGISGKNKTAKEYLLKKIGSELELVPDLIANLSKSKPPKQILVGFAALTGSDTEIQKDGEQKRLKKGCDILMANPIDRDGQGLETNCNGGWLLSNGGMVQKVPVTSKLSVAHRILDAVLEISKDHKACIDT